MTLQEAVIQAMTELNWPEARINSVLEHMDREDPVAAEKAKETQVDPEIEQKLISALRVSYMLGLGAGRVRPMNN